MATIIKRGKSYCVVYPYLDQTGTKRQKWETFPSQKKAQVRKVEVEKSIKDGTFIIPDITTVSSLMEDFVELYGKARWGVSRYDSCTAQIRNYINPLIGNVHVQDITPLVVDRFIQQLSQTRPVAINNRRPKTEYLTPCSIDKILRLLHCAFRQAVRWGLVGKNPFDGGLVEKPESEPRAIWDTDTIVKALTACRDSKLYVAINLSFACSLRIGEICGLRWENVYIDDDHIARDDSYVEVKTVLNRVSKSAMTALSNKGIFFVFPEKVQKPNSKTQVVLKIPKTKSSVRKVWLPKTLAYILREWKDQQEKVKAAMGSDYTDYGLVIALEDGSPCEDAVITNAFRRLKKAAGLPNVVFHSLRHSSTTYKLRLLNGDIKSVQGDNGHAQASMVTEVYGHILDESRKINAQKFNVAFYANPDLRQTCAKAAPQPSPKDTLNELFDHISQDPDLAAKMYQAILLGMKRYEAG